MAIDRRSLIAQALEESAEVKRRYPDLPFLESIHVQLQYLADLIDGRRQDRERLNDIIIGVLAAREVETLNVEYADLLHEISGEVEKMRFGM